MAAITLRSGLGRNLTPAEVDANFTALNDENAAQQTTLNSRAPLASPTFTGTPAAPTPGGDDNTTRIATTAFVLGQASNDDPLPNDTTASPGTSTRFARADHVHVGGGGGGTAAQNALTPASSTVPPTVDAVVAGLADKANSADVTTLFDTFSTSVNSAVAAKYGSADLASQAEAELGTANNKLMTPQRSLQQLIAKVPTLVGGTNEVLAMSGFGFILPNGLGSSTRTVVGLIEGVLDTSAPTSAGTPSGGNGNFKRMLYRTAASAINRAAGVMTNNGYVRWGSQWSETTILAAIGDTNFASGTFFAGLVQTSNTVAFTTTQPSAIPYPYIGFGCDESDANFKIMWRPTTSGTITKQDIGIARVQGTMFSVYIRPAVDMTSCFVRITQMSTSSGLTLATYEYTITANLPTASGNDCQRVAVRSTMAGVAADGVTGFFADLSFGGIFAGRVPVLNYGAADAEPVPTNRAVTSGGPILGTDVGAIINFNSASTAAFTLGTDTSLGFTNVRGPITIYIKGIGVPTITAGGGVNITGSPPSLAQGDFLILMPTGEANSWDYA